MPTEEASSYHRARYYDPNDGRFLSEDPLGFFGGRNFFAYTWNNPVNFTDPGLTPGATHSFALRAGLCLQARSAGESGSPGALPVSGAMRRFGSVQFAYSHPFQRR